MGGMGRPDHGHSCCAPSSRVTPRTRATTARTASGSSTPASAGSTRRPTTPSSARSPVGGVHDAVKADRWLQVVDNQSFEVLRRWDMGKELAEAGFPDMSSAVRPMAISPGREDGVTSRCRSSTASWSSSCARRTRPAAATTRAGTAARAGHRQGQAAHPAADQRRGGRAVARGVRPRLGAPRHRHQRARAPGSASPARCRTTPPS